MYGEVLKFGAMIVDALVDYRQPVFVYIPPHGELRGGAWVVVDPAINPEQMEMCVPSRRFFVLALPQREREQQAESGGALLTVRQSRTGNGSRGRVGGVGVAIDFGASP